MSGAGLGNDNPSAASGVGPMPGPEDNSHAGGGGTSSIAVNMNTTDEDNSTLPIQKKYATIDKDLYFNNVALNLLMHGCSTCHLLVGNALDALKHLKERKQNLFLTWRQPWQRLPLSMPRKWLLCMSHFLTHISHAEE